MRALFTLLTLFALGATVTPATHAALLNDGKTAGPAQHVVVLADGRTIGARTAPVIAFGKVSFVGTTGSLMSLDVRAVNVVATRAQRGQASMHASRVAWNDRNLPEAAGHVQVLGENSGPPPVEIERNDQLDLLRQRVEEVEARIAELGPDHPSTARLLKVQQELQTEVGLLLHSPSDERG